VRRRRTAIETVGMSFLDAIFCGFGAIVLLFVLSEAGQPNAIEQDSAELQSLIRQLEAELERVRGDADLINRELAGRIEQIAEEKENIARLQGDLSDLEGEFQAARDTAAVQNTLAGKLAEARQELTEEMMRLQRSRPPPSTSTVGGVPVDSEYIIFIIDTSGSMQSYAWPLVQKKMQETLAVYPRVKGIQVMNDMGTYMFPQYAGEWIPDTEARRKAILQRLQNWNAFSNSSPVEGIEAAIRTFYQPGRKISLYVFGDEFSGGSIDAVLDSVDRLNRRGAGGERLVRIHAVGFPVVFGEAPGQPQTGVRFAMLMRLLTERNGGAFIGLDHYR
jgi:hypothetical protein